MDQGVSPKFCTEAGAVDHAPNHIGQSSVWALPSPILGGGVRACGFKYVAMLSNEGTEVGRVGKFRPQDLCGCTIGYHPSIHCVA